MLRWLWVLSSARLALGGNKNNCIENTGGSCAIQSCAAWRGNTRCDGMRCFCDGGTCAGSDEACYPSSHADSPYTSISSGGVYEYEIQNARWPEYFMYVQTTGALRLSTDHDGSTSLYNVKRVPTGASASYSTRPASYLVTSKKWPNACLQATQVDGKVTPSSNNVDGALGGMGNDPPINRLLLTITKAPPDVQLPEMLKQNKTVVMLSNPQFANYYFYVSSAGWQVQTWKNDPGAGGYWYIKTRAASLPLPMSEQMKFFTYTGPRCSWSCGKASAKAHSESQISLAALAAVLAAIGLSSA